jgi:alcohol dehydrogenase
MAPFDLVPRTRVVYGPGCLSRLGELGRELGWRRALLVSDRGLANAGHPVRARRVLEVSGIAVASFEDFDQEPDAAVVERGVAVAREAAVDALVALGDWYNADL